MLTALRVKNFKALRDIHIPLGQRNVFIGPNKSGKSTILQVLTVLARLMNKAEPAALFNGQLGFQQSLWKGISDGNIEFEIEGVPETDQPKKWGVSKFKYVIEIGLDALKNLAIKREHLVTEGPDGKTRILIEAALGTGKARRLSGDTLFENPGSSTKPFLSYEIPGWEANELRSYIAGWQYFSLVPELPKITASQASAQPFLDAEGAQLSAWLHMFQANYPDAFGRIVEVAKEAFPEIEFLSTPIAQSGTTFIASKERGLNSPISIFYASDGEIKFLQLLSIIFSPLPMGVVAIEEPENYLHPRLLELLVETADRIRIENEPNSAQVFATTHSPFLVDKLNPEDVIVVEKIDGATKCTRASDKAGLRRMLEEGEMSFGQLWYSGALGGV
jgi:predicted ATPase